MVGGNCRGPRGKAYKNNLDLTVTVGGNTYLGNVFSGANSITGGSADVRNNVESVFLAAGVSGPFTVTVTAFNINSNGVPNVGTTTDQDFALVVYNASVGCALPGDLNEDGSVDGRDIQLFVDCLLTGSTPSGNCACGDFTGNHAVDMSDISLFVNALLGG